MAGARGQEDEAVYLDYNASTPVCAEAAEAMRSLLPGGPDGGDFHPNWLSAANPSSPHGSKAKSLLNSARERVAASLRLPADRADEIVFTSGGTESNNWALLGAVETALDELADVSATDCSKRRVVGVVTTALEHPSVAEVASYLASRWGADGPLHKASGGACPTVETTIVPCDSRGFVSAQAVADAVNESTAVVSVMLANNEVGTVQPLAEIVRQVRSRNPRTLIHTDACQAMGKISVDAEALGVDMLTLAGHKVYATRGVGALYVRKSAQSRLAKFMIGAGHERGLRAGTENSILIAGFGAALHVATLHLEEEAARLHRLRALLLEALRGDEATAGVIVNSCGEVVEGTADGAHTQQLLPNTLSVSLPGVNAALLVADVGARVCVTAGSACHAATLTLSPVLTAMGLPEAQARGTLRLSVGRYTTEKDVRKAAKVLAEAVPKFRAWSEILQTTTRT